ncbi:hypothetical protein ACU4GD_06315 [Cupriavidus basilensis]
MPRCNGAYRRKTALTLRVYNLFNRDYAESSGNSGAQWLLGRRAPLSCRPISALAGQAMASTAPVLARGPAGASPRRWLYLVHRWGRHRRLSADRHVVPRRDWS